MKKKKIILCTLFIILFITLSFFALRAYANGHDKVNGIFLDNTLQSSEKIIKEQFNEKTIQLDSKDITLNYTYSVKNSEKELDIYVDPGSTEYVFDDDKMVGFIKDVNLVQNDKKNIVCANSTKSQGQILDIAIGYFSEYINNFEEYELISIQYISSYNEYSITYMNKCNGYNTFDTAQINITPNGEIVSFCANNQGIMAEYENSNIIIDQKKNCNFIENTLNNKFGNYSKYEINDKILTKIDNKLAIQYYISLELDGNYNDSAVIICYID